MDKITIIHKQQWLVAVLILITWCAPVIGVEGNIFRDSGTQYLQTHFPKEEIKFQSEGVYIQSETNESYTILKSYHNGKPITLAIRHKDNSVGEYPKIESDYIDYIHNLSRPYQKMYSSLRIKINNEFNRFPARKDLTPSERSTKIPVGFDCENTHDLVKIAREIYGRGIYPYVWNGDSFKFVSAELDMETILTIAEMTETKAIWFNHPVTTSIIYSTGSDGVNSTYLQDQLDLTGDGVIVSVVDTGVGPINLHPDLPFIPFNNRVSFIGDSYDHSSNGHGTLVGGIITGQNSTYRSMAPDVTLLSAKVMIDTSVLSPQIPSTIDRVISGLDWSSDDTADIVSLSLGFEKRASNPQIVVDGSEKITKVVDYLIYNKAVNIITAVGNEKTDYPRVPADAYNSISVGATTGHDDGYNKVWRNILSGGSNGGMTDDGRTKVDVVAPGQDIYSLNKNWNATGQLYTAATGTSLAAPHVSGLTALLWQYRYDHGFEDWHINSLIVKAAVINSAKKIKDHDGSAWGTDGSQQPLDMEQGSGRIDSIEAYNTINKSGRILYDSVIANSPNIYYINVTDAPTNITLSLVWYRKVVYADINNASSNPVIDDIDLKLYNISEYIDPTPMVYAQSTSVRDSVEHIFTEVKTNGEYVIEVYPFAIYDEKADYALASSHPMYRKISISLPSDGWHLISFPMEFT
ncbi:Subtilisin-like serine protease [uncultured archaeon]|nr:Subtilisin-like serine protease [uncultured archaeon]